MINLNEKKTCSCIGCGNNLQKNDELIKYCDDCFMGLQLQMNINNPDEVISKIEDILKYFIGDVSSAFHKDPAAKSIVEVLTTYPGIQAVLIHRVSYFLSQIGLPFVPRYLSSISKQITGVDIHPGAVIGANFFIDHGSGVVIGETCEIGNNVTLYQGVTLGGTSLESKKRHPTLGNNVIVGAGAKILGPVKIGNNVKIGANSVVTKDIPDNSVVVGVPGRIIKGDEKLSNEIKNMAHNKLPDPLIEYIDRLEKRITNLEGRLEHTA